MTCPSCKAENRPGAWGCRRCQKALPTLVAGDVVVGRFEILGLLGTGGMGVVFKARDRTLEETVALKTLRAEIDATDEMANRFRSEIRLARKVSSRQVCRIYEYGVDGALHYISMEYVDGVTLKDLLRESGGLPVDVALDIASQIAAGLASIHDVGIMHRDVKPANVMRTRTGLVKLMDFGIAKQIGGVTLTAAGKAVGTPEYMSPEQVTGQKLDLRTDLYTTGIVVFELLTGVSPFRAETPLEAAHKQVTEAPNFQTPGIPATMVPVLSRALAKNREARFRSARELYAALARVRRDLEPRGARRRRARRRARSTDGPAPVHGAVPGDGAPGGHGSGRGAARSGPDGEAAGGAGSCRAGAPLAGGGPGARRRPRGPRRARAVHGRGGPREDRTCRRAGDSRHAKGPRRRDRRQPGGGEPDQDGQDRRAGAARGDAERAGGDPPARGGGSHPHRRPPVTPRSVRPPEA
jgi:hypothetical protein